MITRNNYLRKQYVLVIVFIAFLLQTSFSQRVNKNDKMAWWREAKFGLFIHWGLYAVPAGTWKGQRVGGIGEWIQQAAKIPVAEYAAIANEFNPVKFNADEWVSAAKAAGMKYIVITAKHHDGFAMFNSKATDFNIVKATPFKRDPLKELAVACKKQGIKLGFYYSHAQDWHHAGAAAKGGHWDSAQNGNMDDYIKNIAAPQVKELLTNYGTVSVLFWDTPFDMTKERAAELRKLLALQPNIIENDRLLDGDPGDYATPEQFIPSIGLKSFDWEGNMTMNGTWGYKSYDNGWKSTKTIIRNLVEIASKGGNYLLNVGPDGQGLIPEASIERLHQVGAWMKTNGEAIYGTSSSPLARQPLFGRCTYKPGKLYLTIFDWQKTQNGQAYKVVVPILNQVQRIYFLNHKNDNITFSKIKDGIEITLPKQEPDTIASVMCIELIGPVKNLVYPAIKQSAEGIVFMPSTVANIVYRPQKDEANKSGILLEWKAELNKPGMYEMILNYDWGPGNNGDDFVFSAGKNSLKGKGGFVKKWAMVQTISFGNIKVDNAGINTFTMKSTISAALGLMRVRSITLKPFE